MEHPHIPPDSQQRLIHLSREALESFVRGQESKERKIEDPYLLRSDHGAFVSLHRGGELRGCIGTCFPTRPLYETVIEMTEAAASRDHRVLPVNEGELVGISIEISVLSPLQPTQDLLALEVGKHGLHVAHGERIGVLLPQVATHYGWDMETFLSQACVKAGLPQDAWQGPETTISTFTALIIEEKR